MTAAPITKNKTWNVANVICSCGTLNVVGPITIAYNEPITRIKIDEVRGVNSSQIVRRLLARGFIKICGKEDSIGKPNLYKTTDEFLDYFGLSSKEDLPDVINQDTFENENPDLYDSTFKETN